MSNTAHNQTGSRDRRPAGTPQGGRFAPTQRDEADVELAAGADPDPGQADGPDAAQHGSETQSSAVDWSEVTDDHPVFYTLPATLIEDGMSTSDGQDILDVTDHGTHITAVVYTPSDDEEEDEENRSDSETRIYARDEIVDLAVFSNTEYDGRDVAEELADVTARAAALDHHAEYGPEYRRDVASNLDAVRHAQKVGDHQAAQRWLERAEVAAGVRDAADTLDAADNAALARKGELQRQVRDGKTAELTDAQLQAVMSSGVFDPVAWDNANAELSRRRAAASPYA